MAKKELKQEELENVIGGIEMHNQMNMTCPYCGEHIVTPAGHKIVPDGCGTHNEYKCPFCEKWIVVDY